MNKLSISKSQIVVTCKPGDTATIESLQHLYPIHSNRKKTQFTLSSRYIPEVLSLLRGVTEINIHEAPKLIVDLFYREQHMREAFKNLLENGPSKDAYKSDLITLDPHQLLGVEISRVFNRFAFFYDTRTGKTPMSLAIIDEDLKAHPNNKWLVVCPLILIENAWKDDAPKFFPHINLISCHASTKAKRLALIESDASVYVTNTESFCAYKEYFEAKNFTGVFVDESSDMKSPKSKVSNALVDFAHKVDRFYLLSGTPAPNGEHEYFMQMRAIDFYSMPQSYSQFKDHYFFNSSRNPQYEKLSIRPDREDELMEVIRRQSLYVDKEDVLTTPGRTFVEVEMIMPPELTKHYNKMKNEMFLEIDTEERQITAASAAAKLNKLNQVSSGFIMDTAAVKENKFYVDSNVAEWHLLSDFRFERLLDLLDQDGLRGEQVLIWANYRIEFKEIKARLGNRCACIYGGTTIEEKTTAIKAFKDKQIQYLVANPASADKGLTLTNAHICVYFSLSWSYELYKQSMERIYGPVSRQPLHCMYYILIVKGTIDRTLYNEVLQGKASASAAVLNHLKGGIVDVIE